MWHVQPHPETVTVSPAISSNLVTLADDGSLPAAPDGGAVAWFGEAATGTYCGADFASIKQTPQDGCTSTGRQRGELTSPAFSLAGQAQAYLVFRGWWEIESVNADVADLMDVEYSTDGGSSWQRAGRLNPAAPAWGGVHQAFSDVGARSVPAWQSYAVDISGAAGHTGVRVRFVFDTVDEKRNGFRGLLVDGVAVVDSTGATIVDPNGGSFTDAPPGISVGHVTLDQDPGGHWTVGFNVSVSHATPHDVGADWIVRDHGGGDSGHGHVTIPAGQTTATVTATVPGTGAPYTVAVTNPVNGTIPPGSGESSTPGGALPLVSAGPMGVAPGLATGTVAVTVSAQLAPSSDKQVTVDYTLTGSDGVVVSTGTLVIPAGSTGASATAVVAADHAPYTAGLSNVRNALLDPTGSTATTGPLAGTTAVSSQLIAGVRFADTPSLGQTFLLTQVSGVIRYHAPGGPYLPLRSGTVKLPMGSVVDATLGHARITVQSDANGTLQEGEFWAGKFGVFQTVAAQAVAELRLAGGDFAPCVASARKRARRSATKTVRKLWGTAKGRFRTKGRFASATVRGTRWATEDLCLATRVSVEEGVVDVRDSRRRVVRTVSAGESVTVTALRSGRYRNRRGVHAPRLSRR